MAVAIDFACHKQSKIFSKLFSQLHSVRPLASFVIPKGNDEKIRSNARAFEEIPGPPGFPYIGSLVDFNKRGGYPLMHKISLERFKEYGPIYKETIMGKTFLNLKDQTAAEVFLKAETTHGKYPRRPPLEPYNSVQQEEGVVALLNS